MLLKVREQVAVAMVCSGPYICIYPSAIARKMLEELFTASLWRYAYFMCFESDENCGMWLYYQMTTGQLPYLIR